MTQKELDTLPECGGFYLEDIPGRPGWKRPVSRREFVLWVKSETEEMCAMSEDGTLWQLGWHEGVRYKRRSYAEKD